MAKPIIKIKHLKEHKMSYMEHLLFAWNYGFNCILAGVIAILHGIFPWFFTSTASDIIKGMSK